MKVLFLHGIYSKKSSCGYDVYSSVKRHYKMLGYTVKAISYDPSEKIENIGALVLETITNERFDHIYVHSMGAYLLNQALRTPTIIEKLETDGTTIIISNGLIDNSTVFYKMIRVMRSQSFFK